MRACLTHYLLVKSAKLKSFNKIKFFSYLKTIAINPPTCDPPCGSNAHCEFGFIQNQCKCDSGTSGNPYEVCGTKREVCTPSSCGKNAACNELINGIECVCFNGFNGNPYVQCHDIDECNKQTCGEHAVCFNTPGSFDCQCKPGYEGNPFVMCSIKEAKVCDNPRNCRCGEGVLCPPDYVCSKGLCKNLCDNVKCGPRAGCNGGICECPPGFVGDPENLKSGCLIEGQCSTDADCRSTEICFQLSKGLRKCTNACNKLSCGPNALCVATNHMSNCICSDGYLGDPNEGCQIEAKLQGCKQNSDCEPNHACILTESNIKECIDPCKAVACGENERCKLDERKNPVCYCKDSFSWNPVTSACEKPSIPNCVSNEDCKNTESCKPDPLGVKKCTSVCSEFTCPVNSKCVAKSHRGSCKCLEGFIGNPNDRKGCQPQTKDQCTSNVECAESETCVPVNGANKCRRACDTIQCGPNAICITNNHVAQCQCPSGSYKGDPNDLVNGCKSVPCVYNKDCPADQLCNRLTNKCFNVCDEEDACGTNAICIASDHRANCQCPPGFKPNPRAEIECTQTDICTTDSCHSSAICEATSTGHTCKCPDNMIGDPFATGCHHIGACPNGDHDCPVNSACINGHCVDPCDNACGVNAACFVENRKPVCLCPKGFLSMTSSPKDGCTRVINACINDLDCGGDYCHNGHCKIACRNSKDCSDDEKCLQSVCMIPCSSNSQCPIGQACLSGSCSIGCRSNSECDSNEACINSICKNPCKIDGTCGPNAICNVQEHLATCDCPGGFEGNPTPDQGCVRIPKVCSDVTQCQNGLKCISNQCSLPCLKSESCAIGERCYDGHCAKVCYTNNNCLPGEVCNEKGACQPGCHSDVDCPDTKVCLKGKCKCDIGFIGTPFGCNDINECEDNPCHKSGVCENTPGSFKCSCPPGTVGDAYTDGCLRPNECRHHVDCNQNLACINGKCSDPCSQNDCGKSAECQVVDHQATCHCPSGHLGDPTDQILGCFRVECLDDEECSVDKQCQPKSNRCISKFLHKKLREI